MQCKEVDTMSHEWGNYPEDFTPKMYWGARAILERESDQPGPATDVEIFPTAALRRCLTHKGSVLGLDRHQIIPLVEVVFPGKSPQLGQDLCVDPTEERILFPLAPIS